ncbi:hypothetical protein Btru_032236 [Bulinus truncatus]|nr:hypothetical protein Btru_032236 [Bulinus truncatus]
MSPPSGENKNLERSSQPLKDALTLTCLLDHSLMLHRFTRPILTWIVLTIVCNACRNVTSSDTSGHRGVEQEPSSFGVVTSHPGTTPMAVRDLCDAGGEIQFPKDLRAVSAKLDSCIPILTSSDLGKKNPVAVVRRAELESEANNDKDIYTCCSRLLASLPQHVDSLCTAKSGHGLSSKVCSLLDAGKFASRNHVMNEKYIRMKLLNHTILTNAATFWRDNVGLNETGEFGSAVSNRKRRSLISDIMDSTDSVNEINEMALMDTDFLLSVLGNANYEAASQDDQIAEMSNLLKSVIASSDTDRDESFDSDAAVNNQITKKNFDSAIQSKLARFRFPKRDKARPDFLSAYGKERTDDMTGQKLLAKLQQSSPECKPMFENSVLAIPGCVPKPMLFIRCQGSCSSWTVPEWRSDSVVYRSSCSCCMPLRSKTIQVDLNCPAKRKGHASGVRVPVHVPLKCQCRPCTNLSDVKPEQPYDY